MSGSALRNRFGDKAALVVPVFLVVYLAVAVVLAIGFWKNYGWSSMISTIMLTGMSLLAAKFLGSFHPPYARAFLVGLAVPLAALLVVKIEFIKGPLNVAQSGFAVAVWVMAAVAGRSAFQGEGGRPTAKALLVLSPLAAALGHDSITTGAFILPAVVAVITMLYKDSPPIQRTGSEGDLATDDLKPEYPKKNFDDLFGYDDLKTELLTFGYSWRKDQKQNGILLYGPPGTGKTEFARALAGELNLPLFELSIGSIQSRWKGQTIEQLVAVFNKAQAAAPCVLFFDEIETVLIPRDGGANVHPEDQKLVGAFLGEVNKLGRTNSVLLIGATNHLERCDEAAIREGRFSKKLEVPLPDFDARKKMILDVLGKHKVKVDEDVVDRVAKRWVGFNVPRIRMVAEKVAGKVGKGGVATRGDFRVALREIQGNDANLPENIPSLSDLYLDDAVRSRLSRLATLFRRADDIEERGASVPKAVLFYGPPGTGKTTMAKVLAKESGYAFISTTGSELLAPGFVQKIHARASNLRPAIVFIDEAEIVIGDRASIGNLEVTNELLARIDGVKSVPDVIWIAATNHANVIDPAMDSRFAEKIELPIPGREAMTRLIADWARRKSASIAGSLDAWVADVAALLDGKAPRDVYGLLDSAYNAAVADAVTRGADPVLTVAHVREVCSS